MTHIDLSYAHQVFVIDPPWRQLKGGRRKTRPNQDRHLDYSTLSINNISEIIDRIIYYSAKNHVVFLWVIDKFLYDGEKIFYDRGYKRHARFVWDKGNGIAPAFTVRYSHEYLVWFYKDKLLPIAREQRGKFTTVINAKPREHSRKPDEAYEMIDMLYPDARKLDVFSREARDGWSQWGDEKDYFVGGKWETI